MQSAHKIAPSDFATVIAADLHEVEHTVDELNVRLGMLLQNLAGGRVAAGYSAVLGQPAFEQIGEAIRTTNLVRGHIVAAHRGLDRTADRLNITHSGPLEDKGTGTEIPPPVGRLVDAA